jgi:Fe2+ or Zn2+ uptake regulation protein
LTYLRVAELQKSRYGKGETGMIDNYKIDRVQNYDLILFLKNLGCGRIQFNLLYFWVRHPRSKLSLYTAARALDTARIKLRHAVETLVEKGILTEHRDSNGLTTYALCDDERVQGYIDELAKLDCSEVINLRKQLTDESVSSGTSEDELITLKPSKVTRPSAY